MFCSVRHAPRTRSTGRPRAGSGADIVSVDHASDEQGDAPTTDAAISANGRYVVFQTRATNFFENDGVRRTAIPNRRARCAKAASSATTATPANSRSSPTAARSHAEGPEAGKLIFRGAENPSVSADGRYVAFSTAQQLVPQDTNENVDVYVRDMDVPLTADRKDSGAYTLVSAKSGGEEPATYAPRSPPCRATNRAPKCGRTPRSRADGRYVVFRTTELGVRPARLQPARETPTASSCSCAICRPRRRRS